MFQNLLQIIPHSNKKGFMPHFKFFSKKLEEDWSWLDTWLYWSGRPLLLKLFVVFAEMMFLILTHVTPPFRDTLSCFVVGNETVAA